jgi:preprotein translocase subunit SecB
MNNVTPSRFRLDKFFVEDFKFKREPTDQGKVDIKIIPSGYIDRENESFLLTLDVSLKDSTKSFTIKMKAIGYFKFSNGDPEKTISNYFYLNAPAIVFPYIRAYISAVSSLSGLNAINLPVMNLTSLQEKLKENTIENTPSST